MMANSSADATAAGPGAAAEGAEAPSTASSPDAFADAAAELAWDGAPEEGASENVGEPSHYWSPLPPSELMLRGEEYFR